MKLASILFVCSIMGIAACEKIILPPDAPSCVQKLIRSSSGTPKEVWKYQYKKETVFLVVPDCCDQYISLYSNSCNLLCAPSGGFSGKGDGKCANFYDEATDGVLIWKAD